MMIKVVAALIEKEGKYLIARRSTGDSEKEYIFFAIKIDIIIT